MSNHRNPNARPVVFLDIDDVLAIDENVTSVDVAEVFRTGRLDTQLWTQLILPDAATNLRALHEEFWPQYVISSSWSTVFTRNQMQEIFTRTDLEFVAKNLHKWWTTPKALGSSRVTEIEQWISQHRHSQQPVLVLDDDESGRHLLDSSLDKHHWVVLCTPRVGFTKEKFRQAHALLMTQGASP